MGCEDALQHLMNYVWPNIFETSPHVIANVFEAIEALVAAKKLEAAIDKGRVPEKAKKFYPVMGLKMSDGTRLSTEISHQN